MGRRSSQRASPVKGRSSSFRGDSGTFPHQNSFQRKGAPKATGISRERSPGEAALRRKNLCHVAGERVRSAADAGFLVHGKPDIVLCEALRGGSRAGYIVQFGDLAALVRKDFSSGKRYSIEVIHQENRTRRKQTSEYVSSRPVSAVFSF